MKVETAVAIAFYIEKRGKVTAQELAEKYDVSTREVYRLVDRLSIPFPIYTKQGANGGIFWMRRRKP